MVEYPRVECPDIWANRLDVLVASGSVPSYSEICELASTSSALNIAFTPDVPFRYNEDSVRFHIAQDIEVAHGLKTWLAPDGVAYFDQVTSIICVAETSAVHFEALVEGSGRVLKAGVPLQSELRDWLAKYLLGAVIKPTTPKGPSKLKNIERDFWVRHFLSSIQKLDYPITENSGTFQNSSACHAISDAWSGRASVPSVKRLMNIWSER